MNTYLTIMVTVLVLTQVIRLTQNTRQLKYIRNNYLKKECNLCINHKKMSCPNSYNCYETKHKPFFKSK